MGAQPVWVTACFGDEPEESLPMELATLGEHVAQCSADRGPFVALRCGAAWVSGVVTARLVTSVAVVVAVVATAMVWL